MIRVVGVEYEHKWCLDTVVAANDPHRLLSAPVFERHLQAISDVVLVRQSTVYFDDSRLGLTCAGHSLGCLVNTGALSSIAWLRLKQTIVWDGRRDCLEIAERVDPGDVGRSINEREVLPVGHARRYGMVSGRLAPVAVIVQTRYKRTAQFRDAPIGPAYSVDVVEFRSPDGGTAPLGRYTCLEIEANESDVGVLRRLDALAQDIDEWLDRPRETNTKSQLATWAAHPERRP